MRLTHFQVLPDYTGALMLLKKIGYRQFIEFAFANFYQPVFTQTSIPFFLYLIGSLRPLLNIVAFPKLKK